MSSNSFFRAPSEWVMTVIEQLEQRLQLGKIETAYQREETEPSAPIVRYQCGECQSINHTNNDGRKIHEIELRFLVEVPIAQANFDVVALDLSSRIERELFNERFGCVDDMEEARLISNLPRRFNPDNGVFLRVVTIKQRIFMGPIEHDWHEIIGTQANVEGIS
ncbi:hypothetical protein [Photobacterium piscicola]|uniref:hypothetical protein n=1 Tax=Photobacterium piscicola TaxID=1378299 RepID=UPI002E173632|nr:hypothetical protein [Photobacterium piscicola]